MKTLRPVLGISVIGLGCGLLLAGVHALTEPAIEANRSRHLWQLAHQLVGHPFDPTGLAWQGDQVDLPGGIWLKRSEIQGYAGTIHLLAAFGNDGRLLGARVAEHRETPGLGDFIDIDRSPWMRRFANTPPLAVDAVSGATITSEAVKRGVRQMLGPRTGPPAAPNAP
ncbi:MAG: FMN-binding protein [Gammaproteobacteria bacterium]|nr:FMN-binding protein [Gammaproteobacteria bacterium]